MKLFQELLGTLPDGEVLDVRIGLHWTAVVVQLDNERQCGLASTLRTTGERHGEPDLPQAGALQDFSAGQLAAFVLQEKPTLTSVGMAAINALLPRSPQDWIDANAEQVLARLGLGQRVALIGHFPFVERLREKVGELVVLEQEPRRGDLPATAASQVLPQSQVIAITSMTITNHTLPGLLRLCPADAFVMLLGPTTPLSARLFAYGVHWLSGSIVTDIEPVLRVVSQGGNFRQVHRAGVRLVNLCRPGLEIPLALEDT